MTTASLRLHVEDVSFAYNSRPVVDRISTTISTGECVFLLGANGTGKSTLMRLMAGELRSRDGQILIEDENGVTPIDRQSPDIAYLPQDVQDPPFLTVREVVSLARFNPRRSLGWRLTESDSALVDDVIRQCDMRELSSRQFSRLSGGEKQRAWLAFCLAQQRPFIFLDESLRRLDYHSRNSFADMLDGLSSQGKGIVVISHDLDVAQRVADRVLVLKGGRLVYDGPPDDDLSARLASDGRAA